MSSKSQSRLINFIVVSGLVCSLISISALLSAYHLIFDLFANFRIQYIVLIIGVSCLALYARRYLIATVLIFCMLIHIVSVIKSASPSTLVSISEGKTIRVMSSNLLASNTEHEVHIDYIKNIDPDVIVFQEYTGAWASSLSTALKEYPYKISVSLENPFGIALYSKLPFTKSNSTLLESKRRPSVDGVISTGGSTLRVIGTHPPPPISNQLYIERNTQLQAIAGLIQRYDLPAVILGDLNITPWSSHFKKFLIKGELRNGRRGFGILPTWPSSFLPLQIPIDHVIVNEGVQVLEMQTSHGLNSDHRSIWADLRIREVRL